MFFTWVKLSGQDNNKNKEILAMGMSYTDVYACAIQIHANPVAHDTSEGFTYRYFVNLFIIPPIFTDV